jgi:FtsH-binding integral membrane protein
MYKQDRSLSSNARNNFVVKVYSIIGLQLALTAAAVVLNMTSATFAYIQAHYTSLLWLSMIVTIVSSLVLCN